jgi:hypothetical protein
VDSRRAKMIEVEQRLKKEIEMCQDFESYNDEVLKYHDVMICERDSCETGLKRALEIVNEYKKEKERKKKNDR